MRIKLKNIAGISNSWTSRGDHTLHLGLPRKKRTRNKKIINKSKRTEENKNVIAIKKGCKSRELLLNFEKVKPGK